jgi:hypothetical protein
MSRARRAAGHGANHFNLTASAQSRYKFGGCRQSPLLHSKQEGNMSRAEAIHESLEPVISQIQQHPLYASVNTRRRMQLFMENDVFTCWDCMCLIKELYRKIVSVSMPWFPPKDAFSAALLCSIIGEEESDLAEDGRTHASHFEIYNAAMKQAGANTTPITDFMTRLAAGESPSQALAMCGTTPFVQKYVSTTLGFFELEAHQLAAAFAFGREALTPQMFIPFVQRIRESGLAEDKANLSGIIYFFQRHVQLDGDDHFPKMIQMLENLCENDSAKWEEVEVVATQSVQAKIDYFTAMQHHIELQAA